MGKKQSKNTSVNELAVMIADSFKWVGENISDLREETKKSFSEINIRLDSMDTRLDRIENLLLRNHLNRIERLEDSMLAVKKKVGVR
ncbi:MAG: hypothetical protein A3H68_03060 [Candidatus Taylorbacteria bacterium RIFCSPLOWO2_02_FULL_46_40]|uniref:Uncharacterized protein n=1 Tax=Candidatus Taylorbacteria bacterium RIFCSPLOWO2_02_FULL_46_40 TaxID=1802329 RepID=A0A1G2NX63_9BACT|nr:MAG: hypothetical protein A3H68_03060 [Candidatus Taylorbacteria bacterium RIFCSPLOWO2_02_FULL_46_40]